MTAPTLAPTVTTAAASDATATSAAPAAQTTATSTAAPSTALTYRIAPEQSKASYEVDEVFLDEGNKLNTAIGVTSILSGELTIDTQNPADSKVGAISVDISVLQSDNDRRDNSIRDHWLESLKFPIVTFAPTRLDGLPTTYTAGQELTFKITGDMTVRDTTRSVTFDVTARLDGDKLIGAATTQIKMTDFNFQPPDIAGILKANNDAILKLEFVALAQ